MRTEVPVFRRCCFCIPLRYGILIWGYLKLILCGLQLVISYYRIKWFLRYPQYSNDLEITRQAFNVIIKCMNLLFTVPLIVAAHKKSPTLFKVVYGCEFFATITNFVLLVSYLVADLIDTIRLYDDVYPFMWRFLVIDPLFGLILIGFQLYILAMVRSEILKLESSQQFNFTNIAVEAEESSQDRPECDKAHGPPDVIHTSEIHEENDNVQRHPETQN